MTVQLALLPGHKERGAFFTPPALARFITEWAIESKTDRVLEPSSGEAEFLLAIGERLSALGAGRDLTAQVKGVEIHGESAERAHGVLARGGFTAAIEVADFFQCSPEPTFNAVVGNPPYVRYQSFTGAARSKSQEVALAQGVQLPGLASSWAAFVVHAAAFLAKKGRLGLVLPAELLSVNYAAPVRSFLMRRFASVKLILFESRVFPGVSEEVVLLLAEGEGPTDHCELFQAKDLADLAGVQTRAWMPAKSSDKWTAGLLSSESLNAYTDTVGTQAFSTLQEWGETDLGMVTGNNRYFALDTSAVLSLGLKADELLRISPPSSKHLHGFAFTDAAWLELEREGARTYLFYPKGNPSSAAQTYIEQGILQGVNKAYKCRMRSPWWQVPTVGTPDLFLTYMNHGAPRLVANTARVKSLNSTHGVTIRHGLKERAANLLPVAYFNSLTQLSSELVGRSYGGGMLKLEPREADRLIVPSPSLVEEKASELAALRPQLGRLLRSGKLDEVVKAVDKLVLSKGAGIQAKKVEALRTARQLLFSRRVARANG